MTAHAARAPIVTGAAPEVAAAPGVAAREARRRSRSRGEEARKARRRARNTALHADAAGPPAPAAEPVRPRADCTADTAGGLTFDVRPGACADGDESGSPGEAALLLRLRGSGNPEEAVRLPLTPAEAGGEPLRTAEGPVLRAVLPSTMSMPEGRWDAYLALAGREPVRLLPGVPDLRSLIGRTPRAGGTWLGVRIPYATKFGNLSVRSWLRWPHAEAGPLCTADGTMVVRGRLYGARLTSSASLEAHPRKPAGPPVSVPLLPDAGSAPGGSAAGDLAFGGRAPGADRADGRCAGAPGEQSGARRGAEAAPVFAAALELAALPPGEQVWDLWLRPSAGEEPVRLGRILDDVADKKEIFSYPPQRVTGHDGTVRSVRPYYTLDNDLSLRVSCAEPV